MQRPNLRLQFTCIALILSWTLVCRLSQADTISIQPELLPPIAYAISTDGVIYELRPAHVGYNQEYILTRLFEVDGKLKRKEIGRVVTKYRMSQGNAELICGRQSIFLVETWGNIENKVVYEWTEHRGLVKLGSFGAGKLHSSRWFLDVDDKLTHVMFENTNDLAIRVFGGTADSNVIRRLTITPDSSPTQLRRGIIPSIIVPVNDSGWLFVARQDRQYLFGHQPDTCLWVVSWVVNPASGNVRHFEMHRVDSVAADSTTGTVKGSLVKAACISDAGEPVVLLAGWGPNSRGGNPSALYSIKFSSDGALRYPTDALRSELRVSQAQDLITACTIWIHPHLRIDLDADGMISVVEIQE